MEFILGLLVGLGVSLAISHFSVGSKLEASVSSLKTDLLAELNKLLKK